jgi:hypothetical protein
VRQHLADGAKPNAGSRACPGAHADADSNAGAHADADSNAGAHADANPNAGAHSDADAERPRKAGNQHQPESRPMERARLDV